MKSEKNKTDSNLEFKNLQMSEISLKNIYNQNTL